MDDPSASQIESLAGAPPPPSEVKIRTMRSDLESMAKSGGGLPNFQNIKVAGLSAGRESAAGTARAKSKSNLILIAVILVGLVVLAIGGWFAYSHFSTGTAPTANVPAAAPTPSVPDLTQSNPAPIPTTPIFNLGSGSSSNSSSQP